MTFDEYGQWAAGMSHPGSSRNERLLYLVLALIGESGEAGDNIKNLIRDGTFNEEYLVYELGDLIYYWTCLCVELDQAPSDMLAKSRTNIEQRIAERTARSAREGTQIAISTDMISN